MQYSGAERSFCKSGIKIQYLLLKVKTCLRALGIFCLHGKEVDHSIDQEIPFARGFYGGFPEFYHHTKAIREEQY